MEKALGETVEGLGKMSEVADDFEQRLSKVLTEEGDEIRHLVDMEISEIIAKSREEYKQRIVRFLGEESESIRREAEKEASEIISAARQERAANSRS